VATEQETLLTSALVHAQSQLDTQRKNEAVNRALMGAGVELASPEAASQVVALLRSEVKSHDDGNGGQAVLGPNFMPLDQYVKSRLGSADFKHFTKAGTVAAAQAAATAASGEIQFSRSLEQVRANPSSADVLTWWEQSGLAAQQKGDPRTDVSLPLLPRYLKK
jgi:hypothetical protein